MSTNDQFESFLTKLDNHLSTLNNLGYVSRVFMDSNIDLSKINLNQQANNFADVILSNGFVQTLTRATRIQGTCHSLIDQILINDISVQPKSGILINDISDHFVTFTELSITNTKSKPKNEKKRAFTEKNINNFKNCLRNLSWANVINDHDVDSSFDLFWNDFNMLYDINFPYQKFKFNKNIHSKQGFMTPGLLTSRLKKNKLHKLSINSSTNININLYKTYRNVYNKTLRAMKQLITKTVFPGVKKIRKKHGKL